MSGSNAARAACLVVSAAVLASAAPAAAVDFCVAPAAGCDGGQQPTLQAALNAAKAAFGPDAVRLPPGVVSGPGIYTGIVNPDNTVDLVGAGRDATVVTAAVDNEWILLIDAAGVVSDLTVRQPNPPAINQLGTFIGGTVDRVGFVSVDGDGTADIDGTARHVRSTGPSRLGISGTIEDSELAGSTLYTGTSDTIVRRVRGVAPNPISGQNRSLVVASSLFVSTVPNGTIASFSASPVPNSHATAVLSNVTLIGGSGPSCVGIVSSGDAGSGNDNSVEDVTVANTIVRNCATTLKRDGTGANRTANLTVFNSDLDLSPAAVSQTGQGILTANAGAGDVNTDPLFVGLPGVEQLLRFDSPVVDLGLTNVVSAQESDTDLDGDPRVVDGNGDGSARRDMGAFEYQRRAPTATASAVPTTVEIGQRVAFAGSATEADPGETVTGLAWRFDDGATAAGATASHAFATVGPHVATLSATDSAGATGTATATVTVLAAPAVGSLSLSPKTFRAASKGASVAATRRVAVGTTVRVALTRRGSVKLTVQRRASGRRSGGRCVARTQRNRRAKACTRYVTLKASVTRRAGAPSTFKFRGRWRGRALRPDRYRLVARVGKTPAKTAAFRIVR